LDISLAIITHILPNKTTGLIQPLHQLYDNIYDVFHVALIKDTLFSHFIILIFATTTHTPISSILILHNYYLATTNYIAIVMLGKRPQPLIGKISELLVSGGRAAALFDAIGSPRSPRSPFDYMNLKMQQSPKGLKSYDLGGVGLGIVVALDKSEEPGHEILPKHAVCTSSLNKSVKQNAFQKGVTEIPVGSSEDYTYVTYHVPNKTITKVYYDGGEGGILTHGYYNISTNNVGGVRRFPQTHTLIQDDEPSYPTSDFLSTCHLCRKNLQGQDIYMYRYWEKNIQSSCSNFIMLFI